MNPSWKILSDNEPKLTQKYWKDWTNSWIDKFYSKTVQYDEV